ncbi:hypothetical protein BCR34DRAFT_376364 [Clohesyomyces aquaticus]|uniref:Altered inheritance of mitochondria protein 11 n=1 Tax=Clohesyomyces aquaticus TaxID=1231657 RepID=A0A1Y1ZG53_9PLEO|nr:hypothetical protein BCR34DRAFT_376364 [Clohesyomyces aquaticus]
MARSPTGSVSPSPQARPPAAAPRGAEPADESTSITSPRSLRQLSIFFLGATCLMASTAITRRAVRRRLLRVAPKYYEPNTNPHEHFSPAMDAIQALNLATMNVFSFGIMMVGGALWAVDISSLGEMQTALRGRLGYESFDKPDRVAPEAHSSLEEIIIDKRKEAAGKHDTEKPR